MPFCAFFYVQPKQQNGNIFVDIEGFRPYLSKPSYRAPKWALLVRLMQKERLKSPQKLLILENQAFWVILAILAKRPFWSFWPAISEPGWTRRKKVPLGSCLHQRDRATFEFSGVYTHRKPGNIFYWRGCAKLVLGASAVHVRSRLCSRFFGVAPPKNEKKAFFCGKGAYYELVSSSVPTRWRRVCQPPSRTRIARLLCAYIRPPMSMGASAGARAQAPPVSSSWPSPRLRWPRRRLRTIHDAPTAAPRHQPLSCRCLPPPRARRHFAYQNLPSSSSS